MIKVICKFLLFVGIFASSLCYAQDENIEYACNCFRGIVVEDLSKVDFQLAYEACFDDVYKRFKLGNVNLDDSVIADFIDRLNFHCKSYSKLRLKLLEQISVRSSPKIKSTKKCKAILSGEFEDLSGIEASRVLFQDSVQLILFDASKTFTKSKMVWINPCTYKLIFVESNNDLESSSQKQGDEHIYRIIDFTKKGEIILELEFNGSFLLRRLRKIEKLR